MQRAPHLKTLGFRAALAALALGAYLATDAVRADPRPDPRPDQMTPGSITILGGFPMAAECARDAKAGVFDLPADKICTQALQTEALTGRDMAATLVNRGIMRMHRTTMDEARRDFDMAIRIKPDLGEAYANRGAADLAQHRASDGLADLDRAIALGMEELEKAYFNRGLAHEALDDLKAAYFDYRKALELAPTWDAPKKELMRFTVVSR
ncbi:MAG: hypothetical protein JWQ97_1369 [Phenylobacterium sp.]|nr:hypothetical protein [Phenylobacterium sp.]